MRLTKNEDKISLHINNIMNLNLNKFDKIISLGATCTFSWLFPLKNFHRCVFDTSLATSMWAICQLLDNDFENFLSDMAYEKLYEGGSGNGFATYDKKYFIRTFGNNPKDSDYLSFCQLMKEKAKEFLNLLKTHSGTILFLRQEEGSFHKYYGNRLPHASFAEYFVKPEIDYVKDFSDMVKNINPNLQFKILFLSGHDCFVDKDHNIVVIPDHPLAEFMNKHLHSVMNSHFDIYSQFISQNV